MKRLLFFPMISLAALLALLTACGGNDEPVTAAAATVAATTAPSTAAQTAPGDDGAELAGVTVIPVAAVSHTEDDVDYPTSPPAGGDHNPGWQNCGFYSVAVPDEQAVHSLEHGAVWATYTADTSAADVAALQALTAANSHLLVTLYEGDQDAPIVLTAWGRQAELTSATDPLLPAFLDTYMMDGPTAPEPGASCASAYGIPPTDPFTIG